MNKICSGGTEFTLDFEKLKVDLGDMKVGRGNICDLF